MEIYDVIIILNNTPKTIFMNLKSFPILILLSLVWYNVSAQPCTLKATISGSGITLNPSDPDFRDECKVYVSAKNDGTCGWEKLKVKVAYRLLRFPSKAPRPSGTMAGGTVDLENTVYPKAIGKFKAFDLPAPDYNGIYEYQFYIVDKDGNTISNVVTKEINWD